MKKITKDMMIYEILDMNPQLEDVFISHGLNCVGCPGSNGETLQDAAEGHSVDLNKLLEDLNEANEP
jgi:hybrid cluster-associated redox disulfide protein